MFLTQMEAFSRRLHAKKDPAHDYSHTERIISLCKKIATPEIDLSLVIQAAYFHGLLDEEQNIRHFLKSLEFEDSRIERIIFTVKNANSTESQILEEKILHYANILDALGEIGIARGFMKGGHEHQTSSETMKRKVFTPTAEKMAEPGKRFMEEFLKRLGEEL